MDKNKLNFIIEHFGCYTQKESKKVLTSIGTMSFVPAKELWNAFSSDAHNYFKTTLKWE